MQKKLYEAPPDLAFAILSFLKEDGVATTGAICESIVSLDSSRYAKSTIKKAINSLEKKGEITIPYRQSKRRGMNYIYTLTDRGIEMIDYYAEAKDIIHYANAKVAVGKREGVKPEQPPESLTHGESLTIIEKKQSGETRELNEVGHRKLPDVDNDVTIQGDNGQTGELELVECILVSKSKVRIDDKFFSIPSNIEMLCFERKKDSEEYKWFKGQILTEESNEEKWFFQYKGKAHRISYKARVKIAPKHLITLKEKDIAKSTPNFDLQKRF